MTDAILKSWLSSVRFAGMTPAESAVAREWILRHHNDIREIDFNVRLGAPVQCDPAWPDYVRRCAVLSSRRRADFIAVDGGGVTIVEAKVEITAAAVVQLGIYRALWMTDHPADPAPRLLAIGRSIASDAEDALKREGMDFEILTAT
jgi:hypothetical protein